MPHSHFSSTNGGGIALAENEVLKWNLAVYGTIQETIRQALAAFYGEGPGGGHYQNLTGAYTQVGCGVYVTGSAVTVVEDFR